MIENILNILINRKSLKLSYVSLIEDKFQQDFNGNLSKPNM